MVRFENGVEKDCFRNCFRYGTVLNGTKTTRYVGERRLQNCGEYAEIIELLSDGNCKVRFDSGVEKICGRSTFTRGLVSGKECSQKDANIGDKVLQNCGEYAEVLALLPNCMCKVKFSSRKVEVCRRSRFLDGKVRYKKFRVHSLCVGESFHQECGTVAEIVELLDGGLCLVRSLDGGTKVCEKSKFKAGKVTPSGITCSRGKYVYCKTNERLLSMYFDEIMGNYVGVLEHKNGARYVSVLD